MKPLKRSERTSPRLPEQPPSEPSAIGENSQPEISPTGGRKLRPSAIPIWFLYDVSKGIFGLLPLIFAGSSALFFAAALGLMFLITPAIRYSRFRYDIQGDTLVIEGGLVSRWRRVIPKDRVQSIDVVQKLRHRAFGVLELRIEAVGGKQTEAALVAVLPEEADRIRRWASGGKAGSELAGSELVGSASLGAVSEDSTAPLARLTRKDLIISGITGGRVAVLAILIGYAQEFLGEDTFNLITNYAEGLMPGASLVVIILLLVTGVVVISVVLSIVLTVLIYWDFTVRRENERLVITRGLLEKRRAQIPLRRVQAVQVNENFLRRPLGLASLTVVVAGYSSENQEKEESSMLLPLARKQDAWRVATEILGAPAGLATAALIRSPVRAMGLRSIVPALIGAIAGVMGITFLGSPGAAFFTLVPAAAFFIWISWRSSGNAIVSGYVLIRTGALVRTTSVVPQANIQHLRLTCSVFQKSFRVASISLHIPGANKRAGDMDQHQARTWFSVLGN